MKFPVNSVAFMDFEASGLATRSWPIEVGWAIGGVDPKSVLIAPQPTWPMSAWDPAAERLHGLEVETLHRAGEPAVAVCKMLNASLGAANVYTDAPDYDANWLNVLYQSVGMRATFRIADFVDLLDQFNDHGLISAAQAHADFAAPRTHRAADDVAHLQATYQFCIENAVLAAPMASSQSY